MIADIPSDIEPVAVLMFPGNDPHLAVIEGADELFAQAVGHLGDGQLSF